MHKSHQLPLQEFFRTKTLVIHIAFVTHMYQKRNWKDELNYIELHVVYFSKKNYIELLNFKIGYNQSPISIQKPFDRSELLGSL
jgi:hypothetical protein